MSHLHYACKAAFQDTSRREFETHVTSLSSVHPRDFDVTARKAATKKDKGTYIVRSCSISFVLVDVAWVVLELGPNGVSHLQGRMPCLRASPVLDLLRARMLEGLTPGEIHPPVVGSLPVGYHPNPA